jgi:hypothetical protein
MILNILSFEHKVVIVLVGVFVYRTIMLRRRFNRRLDAAIAAGLLLPEQVEALRRRGPIAAANDPLAPKLWEIELSKNKTSENKWKDIMVSRS